MNGRQGSTWDLLFGGSQSEKIFEPRGGKEKFFRPSRGSGGMLPWKSLKI